MSTRRTYIAISGAIRQEVESSMHDDAPHYIRNVARAIADALQELHPSGFDRARFLKDSGVES